MLANVPKYTTKVPKTACSDAWWKYLNYRQRTQNDVFDGHNPPVPKSRRDGAEDRSREKIKAAFIKKHMAKLKAEKAAKAEKRAKQFAKAGGEAGGGGD
jgi:hypothetical protein